jgi:hypothetical protein
MVTVLSVLFDSYLLWFGVFMGFFVHLLIHLGQWLMLRMYIPAIYTTLVSMIYCLFSLTYILKERLFQGNDLLIGAFAGFGIVVLNLILAHKLAEWYDKR